MINKNGCGCGFVNRTLWRCRLFRLSWQELTQSGRVAENAASVIGKNVPIIGMFLVKFIPVIGIFWIIMLIFVKNFSYDR